MASGAADPESVRPGRIIRDQPLVDLTGLTSPEEFDSIAAIEHVATVVVPRSLAAAYTAIPTTGVAESVFVADGSTVRTMTGSVLLGGNDLGSASDTLIVTGSLVIASPVTGELPGLIHVTGSVLVPRGSEAAIGRVLEGTGAVTGYTWTEGQQFTSIGGQVSIGGGTLANALGEPDDVLLLGGQITITGPVGDIGFRQIIAAGQIVAPATARDVLEPRLVTHGQLGWYATDHPRTLRDAELSAGFLELLDERCSLIVLGDMVIGSDVTADLLRAKVADIVLFGNLTAPRSLLPVLQFLAEQAFGTIRAQD